jgi:hypothetical protein
MDKREDCGKLRLNPGRIYNTINKNKREDSLLCKVKTTNP